MFRSCFWQVEELHMRIIDLEQQLRDTVASRDQELQETFDMSTKFLEQKSCLESQVNSLYVQF